MAQNNSALLISLINNTDNLGLKSIHSSLLAGGHDSHILFYTSENISYLPTVADFINEQRFSIVGISVMSPFFDLASRLSRTLRERTNQPVSIVWGGIHPTIDPDSCTDFADYVCIGEGELSFNRFVESQPDKVTIPDILGISRTDSSEHSISPAIANLDELPPQQYIPTSSWVTHRGKIERLTPSLMGKHNRHNGAYLAVMTSRGCPFSCTYCCNHLLQQINGKKIRKRSPENVIAEIEEALTSAPSKFSYIGLHDDCFTAHSIDWLETFVKYLKPINIPLEFRAIPAFITREKLAILKEAPVGMVILGLQSGSKRTLKELYRRKESTETLQKCARLLDENGIPAVYDVIVDNPYEDLSDLEQTVQVVSELPKSAYISPFSLTFFKYTALYDKAKQDGFPVESHLGKRPDGWAKDSLEVNALKIAALLNKNLALGILREPKGIMKLKFIILTKIMLRLLEPLRYLKMLYMSHGRQKVKLVGLLRKHARDYAYKYFSFSRINKLSH